MRPADDVVLASWTLNVDLPGALPQAITGPRLWRSSNDTAQSRGNRTREQRLADEFIEARRVLLLGHHATVIEYFDARTLI